jgi:hypothetical protein
VDTTDNGDKSYLRTQGTFTTRDQKFESGEGTWNFTGGTGKLKGIKGKGTYKCKPRLHVSDLVVSGTIEGTQTTASRGVALSGKPVPVRTIDRHLRRVMMTLD